MPVVKDGLETAFQESLVHSRSETVRGNLIEVVINDIGIPVISRNESQSRPLGYCVTPLQGRIEVGVAEGSVPVEGESVIGPVCIGLQGVTGIHLVRYRGIEVAE